jgi:hypothetical protein
MMMMIRLVLSFFSAFVDVDEFVGHFYDFVTVMIFHRPFLVCILFFCCAAGWLVGLRWRSACCIIIMPSLPLSLVSCCTSTCVHNNLSNVKSVVAVAFQSRKVSCKERLLSTVFSATDAGTAIDTMMRYWYPLVVRG